MKGIKNMLIKSEQYREHQDGRLIDLQINTCPECGSKDLLIFERSYWNKDNTKTESYLKKGSEWKIFCSDCGFTIRSSESRDSVIDAWQRIVPKNFIGDQI